MALVVVAGAVISCPHGGQLRLAGGDQRLTVAGNGAITVGMEAGLTFGSPPKPVAAMVSPCNAQTPSTPSVYQPCATLPASAGAALKLSVGGMAVLLDTATGPTASGAGPGTWTVASAGQTMLEVT